MLAVRRERCWFISHHRSSDSRVQLHITHVVFSLFPKTSHLHGNSLYFWTSEGTQTGKHWNVTCGCDPDSAKPKLREKNDAVYGAGGVKRKLFGLQINCSLVTSEYTNKNYSLLFLRESNSLFPPHSRFNSWIWIGCELELKPTDCGTNKHDSLAH